MQFSQVSELLMYFLLRSIGDWVSGGSNAVGPAKAVLLPSLSHGARAR